MKAKRAGALIAALGGLLIATASSGECISMKSVPGDAGSSHPNAMQAGTLGLSIDTLLDRRKAINREVFGSATGNGHVTNIYFAPSLWVTTEGNDADLSRFSINYATPADAEVAKANVMSSFGLIANAFRVNTLEAFKDVVEWYGAVMGDLEQRLQDPTKNVFSAVHEKGPFRVTAVAMRIPQAVTMCFEPRDN